MFADIAVAPGREFELKGTCSALWTIEMYYSLPFFSWRVTFD